MSRKRILLANDDGIHAAGLRALAEALEAVAEVWVVAPDRERSATSHAISLNRPLRMHQVSERVYSIDGTPTDCIYFGLQRVMPAPPDLVVSGINDGANLGNDVLYSGTVAAAMEGALFGFGAVAFSLCASESRQNGPTRPEGFAVAAQVARELVAAVLARPMPEGVVLNVNVPHLPREELRGIKLCRLGYTDWADAVVARADPRGREYYWIAGERTGHDDIKDSDNNAVAEGHVSLTPIHYDLTDHRSFAYTRGLELPGLSRHDDALGDVPLAHPLHPRTRKIIK